MIGYWQIPGLWDPGQTCETQGHRFPILGPGKARRCRFWSVGGSRAELEGLEWTVGGAGLCTPRQVRDLEWVWEQRRSASALGAREAGRAECGARGAQLRSSPRELAGLRGSLGLLAELEGAVSTELRLLPPLEEVQLERRGHSGARMLRRSLAASFSSS